MMALILCIFSLLLLLGGILNFLGLEPGKGGKPGAIDSTAPVNPPKIQIQASELNLSSVPPAEMPSEVALRRRLRFARPEGFLEAPPRTLVKLESVDGEKVSLDFQGAKATVSVSATDLVDRILADRKAKAEKAKTEAEIPAHE